MGEQFHASILVFHQCREALDPVSRVVISQGTNFSDGWGVNMSADHPLNIFGGCVTGHGFLKCPDEAHGVFDTPLHIGAERPVFPPEQTPEKIDWAVELEQELVAQVADVGQPL